VSGNSARFISSRDIFTGNGRTGIGTLGETGTADDSASVTSRGVIPSSSVVDINAEESVMLTWIVVTRNSRSFSFAMALSYVGSWIVPKSFHGEMQHHFSKEFPKNFVKTYQKKFQTPKISFS
jgi:hypothetical protein